MSDIGEFIAPVSSLFYLQSGTFSHYFGFVSSVVSSDFVPDIVG